MAVELQRELLHFGRVCCAVVWGFKCIILSMRRVKLGVYANQVIIFSCSMHHSGEAQQPVTGLVGGRLRRRCRDLSCRDPR